MRLLKCYTQYVSKFGKICTDRRTGKGQFSFQSPRRTMLSNAQTTIQLCSFHMLARLCPKSFKLGFSNAGIKTCQMYKMGFEEAEESEIKLSTLVGSQKKQENSRKTSTSVSLTTLKPLTMWITKNCGKLLKTWEYQATLPAS